MSILHFLLAHIHALLLGFFIVFTYVILSMLCFLIVRKYYPYSRCKTHNDIAGFIFATLGVIYAVLLAFIVVATWNDFDEARSVANKEANYVASLYQDADAFSVDIRTRLKTDLTLYATAIINEEWRMMPTGKRSQQVEEMQKKLWSTYMSLKPKNETQNIFFSESVKKMNDAVEMSRRRLYYASSGIHSVLYFILFIGSIITISYTMLFGTENMTEQMIMTSCLAAMISLILYTIIILDYPFTGTYAIKPDAFTRMLPALIDH